MEKKRKIKSINDLKSIKTRIIGVSITAVLVVSLCMVFIAQLRFTEQIMNIMDHYLLDEVNSYGMALSELNNENDNLVINSQNTELLKNITINGQDGSYAYVVDLTGKMLYHPTEEKIGQQVENAVVNQLITDISNGHIPETKVYEYDYHDTIKYAAIYTDLDKEFLLIISADKTEISSTIYDALQKMIFGGMIVSLICIILSIIISHIIINPLKELSKITEGYANYDLRKNEKQDKINKKHDETGTVSKAIGFLRDKFEEVITEIKIRSSELYQTSNNLNENAEHTSGIVGQMETAIHGIADGVSVQAEETQIASENVVQMGNMVEDTTQQIEKLYKNINVMRESGDKASITLIELDKINKNAQKSINDIYSQTNITNQSAMKIQEVVNIISSIAEETNLLSLNASIEAARAGDAGRGFAVVADNIRKLAEQSGESAKQIEAIVKALINESSKAVTTMNEVKVIMEAQNENINKTSEVFTYVKQNIEESAEEIDIIAETTKTLDALREKVIDSVQNLSAIAEENAASTEETSATITEVSNAVYQITESVTNLQKIASGLEEKVNVFKV